MIEIHFTNRQRSIRLDEGWLRAFSNKALAECLKHAAHDDAALGKLEEVDVTVVSDRVIADVHRRFMNIPGATDVITFDHGEILISANTAKTNAKNFGTALNQEVGLYIIHGLLHLNGYEDKTPAGAREMRRLQDWILKMCIKE